MSQFTLEWLKSVTKDEFIAQVKGLPANSPENAELTAVLNTPEGKLVAYEMVNDSDYVPYSKRTPDPAVAAQIAEDTARADAEALEQQQNAVALAAAAAPAAPVTVDHGAEDDAAQAHGVTVVRDEHGAVVKYVVDYQVRSEDGRAIGRPTHFEARTLPELAGKLINAHTNAVTYSERVKNNKFKQSQTAYEGTNLAAAATLAQTESDRLMAEALKEQDPEKMKAAVAKTTEAQKAADDAVRAYKAHGNAIAESWCYDHKHDFLPVQANIDIMGDYIKANNLTMSYENLDAAFHAVQHKLSPVPQQVERVSASVTPSAAAPNNSAAAATATPTSQPASITQADVDAAVEKALKAQLAALPPAPATGQQPTPATANQPTVARRPGVNGGLQPGSSTAARPTVQTDAQTTAETRSTLVRAIGKMSQEEFRKKLRDPNYVKQLEAAGVPYR